jgi:hypothetical protein
MALNGRQQTLTQQRLKELLDYDPATGIFVWVVAKKGTRKNKIAGFKRPDGYSTVRVDGKHYLLHRLAWLFMHGYFPEHNIDHIDRDPSNNRLSNLREATQQCNLRNCKKSKANTSGVTGVYWFKRDQKWSAKISAGGKNLHLGQYSSKLDAAKARWDAERKHGYPGCCTTSSAYLFIQAEGSRANG